MKFRPILLVGLIASSIPVSAFASGGNLWVGPVAMVCLAQNPDLSNTKLGAKLSQVPQYAAFAKKINGQSASCVSKNQFSAELCGEVFNMDPEKKPVNLDALYNRHAEQIFRLGSVMECIEKSGGAAFKD